jgi:hypothetical protein
MPCRILSLTALAFCLVAVPATAQMYKWVDAQGRAHYSDQPPPSAAKAQKYDTEPARPEGSAPASTPAQGGNSLAAQDAALRNRLAARQRAGEDEQANRSMRRNGCESAQAQLRAAENAPARRFDNGGNNFAERTAAINQARASADAACR